MSKAGLSALMKLPLALCPPFSAAEDRAQRPASSISAIDDIVIARVNTACPSAAPDALRACLQSGILALQTPKFYLAGSIEPKVSRARKSGFLQSIDRKNPQFEQALRLSGLLIMGVVPSACRKRVKLFISHSLVDGGPCGAAPPLMRRYSAI
jgi:hypothetical protein